MAEVRNLLDMSQFGAKATQAREEQIIREKKGKGKAPAINQQPNLSMPPMPGANPAAEGSAKMPPQLVRETAKLFKKGLEKKVKEREFPAKAKGLRKIRMFKEYFPRLFDKKEHADVNVESSVEVIEECVQECSHKVTNHKAPDLMEKLWAFFCKGVEQFNTVFNPLDLKLDGPNRFSEVATSPQVMSTVRADLMHLQILYGIQPPGPLFSLCMELTTLIHTVHIANVRNEKLNKKVDAKTEEKFKDL